MLAMKDEHDPPARNRSFEHLLQKIEKYMLWESSTCKFSNK